MKKIAMFLTAMFVISTFLFAGNVSAQEYLMIVVRKGDTITKIAKRNKVSYSKTRKLNEGRFDDLDKIFPGDTVLIPAPVVHKPVEMVKAQNIANKGAIAKTGVSDSKKGGEGHLVGLKSLSLNVFRWAFGNESLEIGVLLFLSITLAMLSIQSFIIVLVLLGWRQKPVVSAAMGPTKEEIMRYAEEHINMANERRREILRPIVAHNNQAANVFIGISKETGKFVIVSGGEEESFDHTREFSQQVAAKNFSCNVEDLSKIPAEYEPKYESLQDVHKRKIMEAIINSRSGFPAENIGIVPEGVPAGT